MARDFEKFTWTTRDGRVFKLCEMTDTHLLNTIKYIERGRAVWQNRRIEFDDQRFEDWVDMHLESINESREAMQYEFMRRDMHLKRLKPGPFQDGENVYAERC